MWWHSEFSVWACLCFQYINQMGQLISAYCMLSCHKILRSSLCFFFSLLFSPVFSPLHSPFGCVLENVCNCFPVPHSDSHSDSVSASHFALSLSRFSYPSLSVYGWLTFGLPKCRLHINLFRCFWCFSCCGSCLDNWSNLRNGRGELPYYIWKCGML